MKLKESREIIDAAGMNENDDKAEKVIKDLNRKYMRWIYIIS